MKQSQIPVKMLTTLTILMVFLCVGSYLLSPKWQAVRAQYQRQRDPLHQFASQHMTAQTRAMIDKALALDSNEITALMLLASDAFMQANYAQAIELWQKVMDLNSPRINRTQLVESINMAKLLQRRSD